MFIPSLRSPFIFKRMFVLLSQVPRYSAITSRSKLPNVRAMNSSSPSSKLDLAGVYPPITTPFDNDGNIAYSELSKNLQRWNAVPMRGYVVQGSNGEFVLMTKEERVQMVRRVREETPADKLVIAGSGCESTRDTVALSQEMSEAGADAVLVITPSYYKGMLAPEGLVNHFTKVADSCPTPVILYSCPPCTNFDMPVDAIVALAKHPNIIGLKDSGGNVSKFGLVVHKTRGEDFQVLAGSGSYFLQSLAVGAVGGVCAVANILGSELCQLQDLYNDRKMQEAASLQQRLIEPNGAVTKGFGVPGLKAAMDMFGLYGGPVRGPLLPCTEHGRAQVREAFSQNGFL